jgi:outer membrane receptor protein involved in Fe transport
LAEVVVTAQRRTERLQDIPLSVSAISGEPLAELGGDGFATFARRVPSLQLVEQTPNSVQLVMRGVVTGADRYDRPETQPTVGLYLDDVPINVSAANPNLDLVDMERLEVLRGPQGTLYGAGSMTGTIRFVTNKPQFGGFEATGSATSAAIHLGGPSYDVDGMVNVPIVQDTVAARVVGYYRQVGGVVDNVFIRQNDIDTLSRYGGRFQIAYRPIPALTLNAALVLQKADMGDLGLQIAGTERYTSNFALRQAAQDRTTIASLTATYDFPEHGIWCQSEAEPIVQSLGK